MPAFIGPVVINNIGGSSTVQFGDTAFISPKIISKNYHGSGSANNGAHIININGISSSSTVQSDLIDQPVTGNA